MTNSPSKPAQDIFTYELPCCDYAHVGGFTCQGGVSGYRCSGNVCARERAALDKFFSQRDPEGDARITEAVDRGLAVHIPCSFYPVGNLSVGTGLSEVCADREGRLYRYDYQDRALVLIFSSRAQPRLAAPEGVEAASAQDFLHFCKGIWERGRV